MQDVRKRWWEGPTPSGWSGKKTKSAKILTVEAKITETDIMIKVLKRKGSEVQFCAI